MSIPTPKYAIGQTVFAIQDHTVQTAYPCPDCLETRTWDATTAAGELVKVPCARCQQDWRRDERVPPLTRHRAMHSLRQLTIGSIQIDTNREHMVWYMCEETGVGSGRNWREAELFATEAEAQPTLERLTLEAQTKIDNAPQALRADQYAKLPINRAKLTGFNDVLWNEKRRNGELHEAIEEFLDGKEYKGDEDELRRAIESDSWRKPNPLEELIRVAQQVAEGGQIAELTAALEGIKPTEDRK